eukprot:13355919-Alexandrium_andersonii.AAC.1
MRAIPPKAVVSCQALTEVLLRGVHSCLLPRLDGARLLLQRRRRGDAMNIAQVLDPLGMCP